MACELCASELASLGTKARKAHRAGRNARLGWGIGFRCLEEAIRTDFAALGVGLGPISHGRNCVLRRVGGNSTPEMPHRVARPPAKVLPPQTHCGGSSEQDLQQGTPGDGVEVSKYRQRDSYRYGLLSNEAPFTLRGSEVW